MCVCVEIWVWYSGCHCVTVHIRHNYMITDVLSISFNSKYYIVLRVFVSVFLHGRYVVYPRCSRASEKFELMCSIVLW